MYKRFTFAVGAFALALAAGAGAAAAQGAPGEPQVRTASASPARKTPPPRVKRPRFKSPEYLRSWGLAAINASPAYRAGVTGRGVTIALVDCGLEGVQPEVARNVSPRSIDIISERRAPPLGDRHASLLAGPLGSALNGRGLLGVAYNATLLSVRADMEGGFEGKCAFRPDALARAVDYAAENGARVIVLPLQAQRPLGAAFEAALARAQAAGAVFVVAAGNTGGERPTYPGRYAADPRFAGSIVAVGATTYDGVMTAWSNRAGEAQRHYVSAPGERILTDCGRKWCRLVSGTSFAAPYVAGGLALVMEAHPTLTGPQAAERLLASARDVGEPGQDAVYGRGVLDIGRVFDRAAVTPTEKGG